MQFYVARQGERSGPYDPDELLALIRQQALTGDDEVWLEGTPDTITVARLLNGRRPDEADARIFDVVRPRPPSLWSWRRRRDEAYFWDMVADLLAFSWLGCLPGCGLITSIGGGGLVALLCIGLYLWGTWDVNRRGAQEQALEALRRKIVRYVDQHPEQGPLSLEQLRQAGAIDADDLELIEELNVRHHPISADSPGEALLFTRPGTNLERRYYKGEATNFVIWWPSPERRAQIVSAPQSPAARARIITVQEQPSGRILATYRTEAFSVSTRWRLDGRLAAVQEDFPGGVTRLRLLQFAAGKVRPLALPEELDPARFLSWEGRAGEPRWTANRITPQQWLANGDLAVESYGGVTLLDENRRPLDNLWERRRFVLRIDSAGRVAVLERKPQASGRAL